MKIKTSRRYGFTLVEVILVAFVFCLLATILSAPCFFRARETRQKNTCIANLQQLEKAKIAWAADNGITNGTPIDDRFYTGPIFIPNIPCCPAGGVYSINPIGVPPTCSLTNLRHVLPLKPR